MPGQADKLQRQDVTFAPLHAAHRIPVHVDGLPECLLRPTADGTQQFQTLAEFFAAPTRPDGHAYRDYRHYLLETSQIPGGFYAARGRRRMLRQVVDMILSPEDPYDALTSGKAAPRQQLTGTG